MSKFYSLLYLSTSISDNLDELWKNYKSQCILLTCPLAEQQERWGRHCARPAVFRLVTAVSDVGLFFFACLLYMASSREIIVMFYPCQEPASREVCNHRELAVCWGAKAWPGAHLACVVHCTGPGPVLSLHLPPHRNYYTVPSGFFCFSNSDQRGGLVQCLLMSMGIPAAQSAYQQNSPM